MKPAGRPFCLRSASPRRLLLALAFGWWLGGGNVLPAQTNSATPPPLSQVLSESRWREVEKSVDKGLAWLAKQQSPDGSFPTMASGQPAVTSFGVLAFLSRGHKPGLGPYGRQLEQAIDFVLNCQRPDGLFSFQLPLLQHQDKAPSHAAVYNHAVSGLMLGEIYGDVSGLRSTRVKAEIELALGFTRRLQIRPKTYTNDVGGLRYLGLRYDRSAADSDLLVTAWQLMFLRSVKNAEFAVPEASIEEAMGFVHRCWQPREGCFYYALEGGLDRKTSRAIVGAGILSLSLAGQHETPMARAAGSWLLARPFKSLATWNETNERFFYSAYYCSQAAAQLGGKYWEVMFPALVDALLGCQLPDGSWPLEPGNGDAVFGANYTTAMAILSLTPPYQLLPVYQR